MAVMINFTKQHVLILAGVALKLMLVTTVSANFYSSSSTEESGGQYSSRIVYDVSAFVRDNRSFNHIKRLSNNSDGNVPAFYYEGNGTLLNETWLHSMRNSKLEHLLGIAFMMFGNASDLFDLSVSSTVMKDIPYNFQKLNSTILHSLIISVNLSDNFCSVNNTPINRHILSIKKRGWGNNTTERSVKLGFEYNDLYLKYCAYTKLDALKHVDYVVLTAQLSPLNTMLSYGSFSERIAELLVQHRRFVRRFNTKCTLYVRLMSKNWNSTISPSSYNRYEALHVKYFQAWINQNPGEEKYIVQYPNARIPANAQFLREKVTSPIFERKHLRTSSMNINLMACIPQEMVKVMLYAFNNILLDSPSLTFLNLLLENCQTTNITTSQSISMGETHADIFLSTYSSRTNLSRQFEVISEVLMDNKFKFLNLRNIFIESTYQADTLLRSDAERLLKLANSKNIQVGCFVAYGFYIKSPFEGEASTFVDKVAQECGPYLFNNSQEILYRFHLFVSEDKQLLESLKLIQGAKQIFDQKYPGKRLIAVLDVGVSNPVGPVNSFLVHQSTYCNSRIQLMNEYQETIVSFANVHNWTRLVLYNDIGSFGFWGHVYISKAINKSIRFPVVFRSNVKTSLEGDLPLTFPCIRWTQNANNSGIDFMKGQLVGSTFEMKAKQSSTLTREELQTAVRVVLGRFSLVELIAGGDDMNLKQISNVISREFVHEVKDFRKVSQFHTPWVYIEVPLAEIKFLHPVVKHFLAEGLVAFHVRDWGKEENVDFNLDKNLIPYFGVTFNNCDDEINAGFAQLRKMAFKKMVNYVVCSMPLVSPSNLDQIQMEKYLHALHYIKSYIEKFLPLIIDRQGKIEVIFRINMLPADRHCPVTNRQDQNTFLAFLDDLTQHSAAYKIKYFVVRAFEPEGSADKCSYSWWHIKDYTDLTNLSVYVSTEDEYFGRPTSLVIVPKAIESEPITATFFDKEIYYVTIPSVLTVAAILILVVMWLRMRSAMNRMLNEKEIKQFYGGVEAISNEMELQSKHFLDSTYLQFPENYEVPFGDIEFGGLIGSGQFGLVYKGVLFKKVDVAIKTPRPNCDKEQFLSALSEVKILGYIGSHQNVVSFQGAYTKEIGVGKLYILTEYCANGSLLGFLRKLQSEQNSPGSCHEVDTYQLYRFSHQIASGMEYVADKRIIHGDLATRNVLLTCELTCKVADFGLSRRLYELNEYKKTSKEPLPWRWMAPESLNNMEFTTKSDVWSYGVTLWEVFSLGRVPYSGKTFTDDFIGELENGMRMGKAEFATDDIHDRILNCWNYIQNERPNFTKLKQYFVHLLTFEYLNVEEP